MNALRCLLYILLAPLTILLNDTLTALFLNLVRPVQHDLLGFGIHIHFTSLLFIVILPLCIFLGNMWWSDRRRYFPHTMLLVALAIWSIDVWEVHPNRTLLFVVCCSTSLPMRWMIDQRLIAR